MRTKLLTMTAHRINNEISARSPLRYLKDLDLEEGFDAVVSVLFTHTRPARGSGKPAFLADIVTAMGHAFRQSYRLKKDSSLAARTGAFILWSFSYYDIIETLMGAGRRGHQAYIIRVKDDFALTKMFEVLPARAGGKFPSLSPYSAWTQYRHETGALIVKTGCKEVLQALTPKKHPMVFATLNKAQEIGWQVNEDVFQIHLWALRTRSEVFADVWEMENAAAREQKTREISAISTIAKRLRGNTFYHLYTYDFRCRKYPSSAYFHEQGSDLARGLLQREESKALGKGGYFWLLVSIASNWAGDAGREDGQKTDKIPLEDRAVWTLQNERTLLSYARLPKINKGWMKADAPWQFLAACIELNKLRAYQNGNLEDFSYESHLEAYIDGSNNGSQHLAALTRDEVTAPHVNLVPQELPGDLYRYVGEHVWGRIRAADAALTQQDKDAAEEVMKTLREMRAAISELPEGHPERLKFIETIRAYRDAHSKEINDASPVFWNKITDKKHVRKLVKRNTMTLPYGGTSYGLGEQQCSDARKHGIPLLNDMEHRWGYYLGREVFSAAKDCLKRPMQLLTKFEEAGKIAEEKGEFLKYIVPFTNFPMVQYYTEGVTKKVWVQYGPPIGDKLSTGYYANTFQMHICFVEDQVVSSGRQSVAAAPNIIHSLDAAHLIMVVSAADYGVTTIHDSYGCLYADMPELYELVRSKFHELHKANPLPSILEQIGVTMDGVDLGSLDIDDVLKSEYAFV